MPLQRSRRTWEARIERAKTLAERYPFASEVLLFYAEIAAFQRSMNERLSARESSVPAAAIGSLRGAMKPSSLLPSVPELLTLVSRVAPPQLREAAQQLQAEPKSYWEYLLAALSNGNHPDFPETHVFFGRVLMQAYAANVAEQLQPEEMGTAVCPVCGSAPVTALLREEAQGAKRSLVCSLCLAEWEYKRIICPACGEEEFDKLPTYRADQFQHLLVEACDTCRRYITTVDYTKDGLAIAEVDELAALPLNLWATEKGYTKIQPNLLGM